MGEQLICKMNPTSDLVKKQLSQLRDQWQTLKQTAANQTRALGGAKNLQEFNKKVDKLEAWIKEKARKTLLCFSVAMCRAIFAFFVILFRANSIRLVSKTLFFWQCVQFRVLALILM